VRLIVIIRDETNTYILMLLQQIFPPIKSIIFGDTIDIIMMGILSVFGINTVMLVNVCAFLILSIWAQFNQDLRNELMTRVLCCLML
jgi:hypothetical protein